MKFTFAPESRPLEGFTVKRAIYRGGFGEVYYAVSDAGREVALKLLQNNADVELRGVQQCLNLSHPNLVTIFDVRKDADSDHWIIMEYVAGDTLDTVLKRTPTGLPVETVHKWLQGMVAGLGYLHSRGLVHRDMKPANVFMENGVVKIGDVGLSKFISPSRHSAQTQSVGTVHYMAPEVAKGKYGREVDVYALGIILYEMLTGQLPFDGESTGEILLKHLSERPDLSRLPPRLQDVVGQALEKDPQDRFRRVDELLRAFEAAMVGGSVPSPNRESQFVTGEGLSSRKQDPSNAGNVNVSGTCRTRRPCDSPPPWIVGGLVGLLVTLVLVRAGGVNLPVWSTILGGALIGALWMPRRKYRRAKVVRPDSIKRRREGEHRALRKRSLPIVANTFGALFVSVPVAVALIGCMAVVKPSFLGNAGRVEEIDPALLGLFSLVTIAAAWVILIVPVLNGSVRNPRKMSAIHYALGGAVVGVIAFLIDHYLMIGSLGASSSGMFRRLGDHALINSGAPSQGGYLVFFATFFGLRNWQELTSPFRGKRFRISSVLWTLFSAWFATVIFSFPTELAIAWGVVIACVTQLSAPMEDRLAD